MGVLRPFLYVYIYIYWGVVWSANHQCNLELNTPQNLPEVDVEELSLTCCANASHFLCFAASVGAFVVAASTSAFAIATEGPCIDGTGRQRNRFKQHHAHIRIGHIRQIRAQY